MPRAPPGLGPHRLGPHSPHRLLLSTAAGSCSSSVHCPRVNDGRGMQRHQQCDTVVSVVILQKVTRNIERHFSHVGNQDDLKRIRAHGQSKSRNTFRQSPIRKAMLPENNWAVAPLAIGCTLPRAEQSSLIQVACHQAASPKTAI